VSATIIRGDTRRLPLADASVDLIVTSPPYWALRSYTDGGQHYGGQIGAERTPAAYVDSLIECTREWMRVLKPSGSMWINLGDKYSGAQAQNFGGQSRAGASSETWRLTNPKNTGIPAKSLMGLPWRYAIRCIDDLGLILRAEVIWSKPNGLPESVTDRVRRSHETWLHFTKEPRYFSAVDAIREPASDFARPRNAVRTTPPPPGNRPRAMADTVNPLGRLPGSVWEIATQPLKAPAELGVDHFAAFPMEWPRRIVQGWSPTGGTVLDPFGGTGTTALVASSLGRHGISVDMSADYCRLAAWRTTDLGQRASAMQVARPPVQLAGQQDLFAIAAEKEGD
jgi:site-specific DNA-methyltransferase (cytosine-N4-specific)